MAISDRQREELLALNDGNPFIVIERKNMNGYAEYGVTLFVRTIASPAVDYLDSVIFSLTFTPNFPDEPPILCLDHGRLFHPNFTDDGKWVSSALLPNESVHAYLMRLARTLEFKEIDIAKLANRNALAWYNDQIERGVFPLNFGHGNIPAIRIYRTNVRNTSPRIQLGEIHYG